MCEHGTHRYDIQVLAKRINMLTCVCQEIEYRIDVWHVTGGSHIEQL
jgi:hypothetical protein